MKKEEKLYSLGEIFKLGLLKNASGEAYKHKATISRVVALMDFVEVKTPHGMSKCLTEEQINNHNKKYEQTQ